LRGAAALSKNYSLFSKYLRILFLSPPKTKKIPKKYDPLGCLEYVTFGLHQEKGKRVKKRAKFEIL
jgi:hypothetical protein